MRVIKTNLENILDLIVCANAYGFEHNILFDAFREMLDSKLTNEEIENYARSVELLYRYSEEDYEATKEQLKDFKNKYCSPKI